MKSGQRGAMTIAGCVLLLAAVGAAPAASNSNGERTGMPLPHALLLGVIEGATEFLPVSSTGHLLIAQEALGMSEEDAAAADAFAICIQAGAIVAVLLLYHGRIAQILRGLTGGDPNGLRLLGLLIVAFLPAAILGLLFHDEIKERLFGVGPVVAALAVGAVLILVAERFQRSRPRTEGASLEELSFGGALLIGIAQCVAFWPGFSRSLATILGALVAGLRLDAAVEFSFLLGLVTLGAATVFEGYESGSILIEAYGVLSPVVAMTAAFLAAAASAKWMVGYLNRHGLQIFAYYRLALAAVVWYLI